VAEVEQLLASGVAVDATDGSKYAWTAFHVACLNGEAGVVEVLVRAGCDTALPIETVGKTGLEYARQFGEKEVLAACAKLAAEAPSGPLARELAQVAAKEKKDGNNAARRAGVSAEVDGVDEGGEEEAELPPKTEAELARIHSAVAGNLLFADLGAADRCHRTPRPGSGGRAALTVRSGVGQRGGMRPDVRGGLRGGRGGDGAGRRG
jgi:hypothetical protein